MAPPYSFQAPEVSASLLSSSLPFLSSETLSNRVVLPDQAPQYLAPPPQPVEYNQPLALQSIMPTAQPSTPPSAMASRLSSRLETDSVLSPPSNLIMAPPYSFQAPEVSASSASANPALTGIDLSYLVPSSTPSLAPIPAPSSSSSSSSSLLSSSLPFLSSEPPSNQVVLPDQAPQYLAPPPQPVEYNQPLALQSIMPTAQPSTPPSAMASRLSSRLETDSVLSPPSNLIMAPPYSFQAPEVSASSASANPALTGIDLSYLVPSSTPSLAPIPAPSSSSSSSSLTSLLSSSLPFLSSETPSNQVVLPDQAAQYLALLHNQSNTTNP